MEGEETPGECMLREVKEETDIELTASQFLYKGVVRWEVDGMYDGGMYIYLVDLPDHFSYFTPKKTEEGILDWKSIPWLLEEKNPGLGEMIPQYLPHLLSYKQPLKHMFVLHNEKRMEYEYMELNNEDLRRIDDECIGIKESISYPK